MIWWKGNEARGMFPECLRATLKIKGELTIAPENVNQPNIDFVNSDRWT